MSQVGASGRDNDGLGTGIGNTDPDPDNPLPLLRSASILVFQTNSYTSQIINISSTNWNRNYLQRLTWYFSADIRICSNPGGGGGSACGWKIGGGSPSRWDDPGAVTAEVDRFRLFVVWLDGACREFER